jgi:hypothetical protein
MRHFLARKKAAEESAVGEFFYAEDTRGWEKLLRVKTLSDGATGDGRFIFPESR